MEAKGSSCFADVLHACMDRIELAEKCYNDHIASGNTHAESERYCKDKNEEIISCIGSVLCPTEYHAMINGHTPKEQLFSCATRKWEDCFREESNKDDTRYIL